MNLSNFSPTNTLCSVWDAIFKWLSGQGVVYQQTSEYVYTGKHFLVLGLALLATIGVFFLFRKWSDAERKKFLKIVAWIMIACEILSRVSKLLYFYDLGKLSFGQAVQVILPIHFCSVIIWVLILSILFDYKPMLSFGVICGFFGCLVYLLYPAEGLGASFIHLRAFNSIFTHSVGFVICVNMLIYKMIKLDIKDMWKTFLLLGAMVAWAGLMNWIFPYDANGNLNNYMFMIYNPMGFDTGVIPYQVIFALLAVVVFSSFYLIPYWINKHKIKKSEQQIIADATKEE